MRSEFFIVKYNEIKYLFRSRSRGVTLIELILVTSIILILGASTTPFISSFISRNNLDVTTDKVVGTIRKAQNYARTNKDDGVWGACVTGQIIRMYRGSCNSPIQSDDFSFPESVTITGFSDTTFSKNRGELSGPLSISISNNRGTNTININIAGGATIQ